MNPTANKTPITESQIKAMHAEYCRLIEGTLPLSHDRIYWWGVWLSQGWGVPELQLVVRAIRRGIANRRRNIGALRFSRLIQDHANFSEEVCMAQAEERNRKRPPTPKERVVSQFRPTVVEGGCQNTARPVSEWIQQLREAAR